MKLNTKLFNEKFKQKDESIRSILKQFDIDYQSFNNIMREKSKIYYGGDAKILKLADYLKIPRNEIYIWEE